MTPLSIWIAFAILFIIIEILTVTFYGLSLALACAIVVITVSMTHATTFTILQGVIFVISSLFFAFLLPRFLVSDEPDTPQGVDKYIGQIRSVRKVGGEWKISLDGVDYPIDSDEDITAGGKVEVVSHHGVSMKVKRSDNK